MLITRQGLIVPGIVSSVGGRNGLRILGAGGGGGGGPPAVTWNPADLDGITLSGGNLQAANDGGTGNHMVRATTAGVAGRYFELTGTDLNIAWGVCNLSAPVSSGYGGAPNGIVAFSNSYVEWPGGSSFNGGTAWNNGDVLGLLLKADTVELHVNGGGFLGLFNPPALPSGDLYPFIQSYTATPCVANFGASPMAYLPTGATSWDGSQSN